MCTGCRKKNSILYYISFFVPQRAKVFAIPNISLRLESPKCWSHESGGCSRVKAAEHDPTKSARELLQPPNRIAERTALVNKSVVCCSPFTSPAEQVPKQSTGSCSAWGKDHATRLTGDCSNGFMIGSLESKWTASSKFWEGSRFKIFTTSAINSSVSSLKFARLS